ncbi:MAG: bifunctional (p)ppGpp synthetase/guanosine-3',5'-bis(diphosphate) 3'-pyrophosphohydrolase [Symbiobacteriaceae bacterium]|nr:bifunctional (p)ppGpp synthetase/guanosine-3',5'-bis(diphosphate) 3'-pyrophosphohydrolase [Symbiobacteriaceae bacterium]
MEYGVFEKQLSYLRAEEKQQVERAFALAEMAHRGQLRLSGEQYIIHPIEVAGIVAGLHLDGDTITAALLHDVIEDTPVLIGDLRDQFGEQVAEIVWGLTKLKRINFSGLVEHQVENYRHFFLSTARDPRVVVIKLADRLHNMRTLQYQSADKQLETAQETLQIFAPLAGRCGIQSFKAELEDLALKYLHPEAYDYLAAEIEGNREELQHRLDGYVNLFRQLLVDFHVEAQIYGRIKHLFSIYRKMSSREIKLSDIYDLLAVRIVTKDLTSCYAALGIVHTAGAMIPSRFRDFINLPKQNGYMSLHTTIVFEGRDNLEVQIRTEEMHEIAEKGVATHWAYKDGRKPNSSSLKFATWMRDIIELGQDAEGVDYLDELMMGYLDEEISVYTPKFDLVNLPRDATPVDFAYRVHTEVGHRCVGAKINFRIAPLDSKLENGDVVEILTTKQAGKGPSPDWLNFVRTRSARERIRSWLKQARREENIVAGEAALQREIRKQGQEISRILNSSEMDAQTQRLNKASWNDVLAALGFGEIAAVNLAHHMIEAYKKRKVEDLPSAEELLAEVMADKVKPSEGIIIDQLDGLVHRLARCCNPIPGEEIVGYVTRGRGVTIHRKGCPTIRNEENERIIRADWGANLLRAFVAPLQVTALNRPHLLQQILLQIQDARIALHSVNARSNKQNIATIDLLVEVSSMDQLKNVQDRIRRVRDIFSVELRNQRD